MAFKIGTYTVITNSGTIITDVVSALTTASTYLITVYNGGASVFTQVGSYRIIIENVINGAIEVHDRTGVNLGGISSSGSLPAGAMGSGIIAQSVPSWTSYQGLIYIYGLDRGFSNTIINPYSSADHFGYPIAITNNIICIGATYFNSGRGRFYIYNTSGTLIATVTPVQNLFVNQYFPQTLTAGCGRIVASQYLAGSYAYVYIYSLTGALLKTITSPDGSTGYFGMSVAIGCGKILIGEYGYNSYQGRVFLYDLNGNLLSTLVNPLSTAGFFGISVAVGSGYIAIGASGGGSAISGNVYIYDLNGNLLQTITDPLGGTYGNTDGFGASVSINSGLLAVCNQNIGYSANAWLYHLPDNIDSYYENILEEFSY